MRSKIRCFWIVLHCKVFESYVPMESEAASSGRSWTKYTNGKINSFASPVRFVASPHERLSLVQVRARLEDNFDTPGAMSALDKLISAVNKYLRKAQPGKARALLLRDAALLVKRILYVFGKLLLLRTSFYPV